MKYESCASPSSRIALIETLSETRNLRELILHIMFASAVQTPGNLVCKCDIKKEVKKHKINFEREL